MPVLVRLLRAALVVALALVLIPGARAADFYVDATLGNDGNAGDSWAQAVQTIGQGMVLARGTAGPDRILVAEGTYVENVLVDESGTQLLGGHPTGGGTRDPAAHPTIVDGSALRPVLMVSGNAGRTLLTGVVVDGFTFRNGKQLGDAGILGAGSGVFIEEAETVLTNNVIRDNVSDGQGLIGAGVYVYRDSSRPSTISNNRIENNLATNGSGGGVAILDLADARTSVPIDVSNNDIVGNRATALATATDQDFSGLGGGVFEWHGKARLDGNRIQGNTAEALADVHLTGQGGGLFVVDASPIITNNTITQNVARGLAGEFCGSGGGMYGWWSTLTRAGSQPMVMTGNTVTLNRAEGGYGPKQGAGGGVYIGIVGDTELTLTDNDVTGNVATGGNDELSGLGGGYYAYLRETGPAYLTVTGGLIENNRATRGGGGVCFQGGRPGRLGVTGLTVRNNRAVKGCGVMFQGDGVARNLRVRDNVLDDADGDLVPDVRDACPGVADSVNVDTDGDGLGDACDPDDDDDGTPDASDPCPLARGATCAGDFDNDGAPDGSDNCPNAVNRDQADSDRDGVGDACEPWDFGLTRDASAMWVNGNSTITNVEISRNDGHGLVVAGTPADLSAGTPDVAAAPIVTNVTMSLNRGFGLVTYLADGTLVRETIVSDDDGPEARDRPRITGGASSTAVTCNDVFSSDEAATLPCNGTGNLGPSDGPIRFVSGPLGDFYLAQVAAGQPWDSIAVDAGGVSAAVSDVNGLTTRTDEAVDASVVDLGYHYPLSGGGITWPTEELPDSVRVGKDASSIVLSLVNVPPTTTDVRWYRGEIPALTTEYSHRTPFTGLVGTPECDTFPTAPVSDPNARLDGNDWYYLAVVLERGLEGPFGEDSFGNARPRPEDSATDRVTDSCP